MEPVCVSITEAAKALGLGRTSIYALIDEKQLDAVKVGRRRLILVDSIKRPVTKQD